VVAAIKCQAKQYGNVGSSVIIKLNNQL